MPHSSPPPAEGSRDPPRRMRVYQLAEELRPATWEDAKKLAVEPLTQEIGRQLYAAVSSIAANMSEGYSRSSGRDRVMKKYAVETPAQHSLEDSRHEQSSSILVLPQSSIVDAVSPGYAMIGTG